MKSNTLSQSSIAATTVTSPTKGKDRWRLVLKTGVGALLIYYVLHSKMVDFTLLQSTLLSPLSLCIGVGFLAFSAACCAVRWHLLVKTQGLSLSMKDVFELTMIGYFFNTFMPGSVGGDLIKAWYAAGQEPRRKTKAVFTVFLDRVIGLWIIVCFAAVTLLLNLSMLSSRTELRLLALAVWTFTTGTAVVGILFFATATWEPRWLKQVWGLVRRSPRLGNLLDSALIYRHAIPTIAMALMHLQKAADLDPRWAKPQLHLGVIYYKLGQLAPAVTAYQKAIALDPRLSDAYNNLAVIFLDLKKTQEAQVLLGKGRKLAPFSAEIRFNQGRAETQLGHWEKSLRYYRDVLKEPYPPEVKAAAHHGMGDTYLTHGDFNNAISHYLAAIELAPQDAEEHVRLGYAMSLQGKRDLAVSEYDRALQLDPKSNLAKQAIALLR